jgi:NADPH:quinone reductase-like Zn-dependent oxidoreductase
MTAEPTMRAVTQDAFGGPEVLRPGRVPRRDPLPTEIEVRVHAAGVNPVDWKTRSGAGMARVLGDPPFVLGWDVSGTVERVGLGVNTVAPGDEVYGMPWFPRQAGGYAEFVTAPSRQFARKPASVGHPAAAGLPLAALTAWQALTSAARLRPGQHVLIHAAAGGVGHFAVQFAKHLGARVTGTARAARHDWLRDLGADELVDYTTTRFEEAVSGADVVLDLVGDAVEHTSTRSLDVLRPGGTLVVLPSNFSPGLLDTARERGLRGTGFIVEPDGASLTTIASLVDDGTLTVDVAATFPLADAAEAHREGERGHTRGKLVLEVAG